MPLSVVPDIDNDTPGVPGNRFWRQPLWYVDPQDSSGHASDFNVGNNPAAPLLTYSEIVRRWGTYSPDLPQPTTITFLSDQTTFDDPVIFTGTTSDNGSITLVGQLVQLDAGTFSAVTPENPGANQRWLVTDAARAADFWAQYVGYFVHDTTQDDWFWVDANTNPGGKTATITEPMAQGGLFNPAPAIVATGQPAPIAGDAYVVYRPTLVYVPVWNPIQDNGFSAEIQHVWITAPNGLGGFNAVTINTFVQLTECRVDGLLTNSGTPVLNATNCWFGGGLNMSSIAMNGGSAGFFGMNGTDALFSLDGGAAVNGPFLGINGVLQCGFVFVNGTMDVPNPNATGSTASLFVSTAGPYGLATLWGPGGIALHANAELDYTAPAVGALLKTPITEKGFGTASNYNTGTGAWTPGIALTPANLDAPLPFGFGGIAYGNGGSKIRALF